MEAFFPLIEQFHTQSEPAFCGLGALVVALNALGIDPGRLWQGPWRWFSEELLDCCLPLEQVRVQGITLEELACLARCNGADVELSRPAVGGEAVLRGAIEGACGCASGSVLIVGYDRAQLGQTGRGHFSPIGGYHRGSDRALILDVARFKYPPHWVPVPLLYSATVAADPMTGRARGWAEIRRGTRPASLLFAARWHDRDAPQELGQALDSLRSALAGLRGATPAALLELLQAETRAFPLAIATRELADEEHADAAASLRMALRETALFSLAVAQASSSTEAEALTVLALALPDSVYSGLGDPAATQWSALVNRDGLNPEICVEVEHVREQLRGLCAICRSSCFCS